MSELRTKVETPLDMQVVFAQVLQLPPQKIKAMFDFEEDKEGYITAKNRPKVWLDTDKFKVLARAIDKLGGQYSREKRVFQVPGPALKQPSTSQDVRSKPQETPKQIAKPVSSVIAPGYYPNFPTSNIISPRFCFRTEIAEDILELMAEINAAGHIIEPLICKPSVTSPGNVYLGPGERRLLAAKELGMKTVPVIVDDFSDVEFDKIRLLENVARKDLTDYEVARGLDYMLRTYPQAYPTQEALANDLQKNQEWISHHLAILRLEKDNIMPRAIMEKIDEGHAREILATPEDKRPEVVRRVEEVVKATGKAPPITEMQEISGRRATVEQPEPVTTNIPSTSRAPEAPAPKPSAIDTGLGVTCGECGLIFTLIHRGPGPKQHRLQFVNVVKEPPK